MTTFSVPITTLGTSDGTSFRIEVFFYDSPDGRWKMCDGFRCIECIDDPKCAETSVDGLVAQGGGPDKDKSDLKRCPHGWEVAGYRQFVRTMLPDQYLRICHLHMEA